MTNTWSFKVFIEKKKRGKKPKPYYRVIVYHDLKKLRVGLEGLAFTNNWRGAMGNKRTCGRCIMFSKPTANGECGLIALSRVTGAGTVAHEMFHVAWHWLSRYRQKLDRNRDEEKIAYLIQSLVSQYWTKYREFEDLEEVK